MAEQEEGIGRWDGNAAGNWTQGEDNSSDVSSDVELLRQVWSNEKAAPEILPYEEALVGRVREQLLLLEETIANEISDELSLSLYRMDVNRTFFLLRSYLRTRLSKIERYPVYIATTLEALEKLSDNEKEYATGYTQAFAKHMEEAALKKLPGPYRSILQQSASSEEDDMHCIHIGKLILNLKEFLDYVTDVPKPQLDTFVFCKCKEAIGAFQVDEQGDETVDLMQDDLHILRYRPIRSLLEFNRINLI